MANIVEAAARSYGIPLALVRRAMLAEDVRDRLTAIEQRAAALRYGARTALEDAADLRTTLGQVQREVAARRRDVRWKQEDATEAEALVALLEAEVARAATAAEAAQERAADAGRVAENVRSHLGLTGGSAFYDRTRTVEAAA